VDLFEPGSGSQVHDFNAGIPPSGLFWTVALPAGALKVVPGGRRAFLTARHVPVVDSFQFLGSSQTPAEVSFSVTWNATGQPRDVGSGKTVDATDAAAFLGRFADARATGTFQGSETGFRFRTSRLSSARLFAQMGTERNGIFLR
jgi:hypothetical protein